MENSLNLANRFLEVILSGTWIANTNFKKELENLDWEIATKKIENLNTIADLAQHIHYYIAGMNNVFNGGNLEIKDKFSFDFAPLSSQKDWKDFLLNFWSDSEKFANFVKNIPNEKLDNFFADEKYGTISRNIDAMIEHSYYHLGQIVLIKKILSNK